ncbi:hypothetical protein NDU88_004837 [Pleurodeles waltl]|uniref:Uncharacterized protein n=1 Tax=Pleurodeles waltl TaxID=8319 RepID=A0AAV7LMH3_PLEWA|nr:hypothetical protein NDU88_004837 [Pleurodeles waltl]
MTLTRGRKKSSKEAKARLLRGRPARAKKRIYRKENTPNPAQTKKSPCKSPSKGKKAGYKITDFLFTEKESNSTSASIDIALANDSETTSAVDVKTVQDIERTCADQGKTKTPIPQPNKTGLTINAEIHRCYQNDTFSSFNLSNWNNWGECLCCTPFSKQPSQVEKDTDCIIIEEFPLIDLSDTCSDTPQGNQIANNKTKLRSTCSTRSPRKDRPFCKIITTTTSDTHVTSAVMAMEQPEQLEELEDPLDHTTGAKSNVEPSTAGDSWNALLATMDAMSAAIQFQADKQDTHVDLLSILAIHIVSIDNKLQSSNDLIKRAQTRSYTQQVTCQCSITGDNSERTLEILNDILKEVKIQTLTTQEHFSSSGEKTPKNLQKKENPQNVKEFHQESNNFKDIHLSGQGRSQSKTEGRSCLSTQETGPPTGGSKELIPNNSIVEESSLTKREMKRKRKAGKKSKGVQQSRIWKSFAKSNGMQSKESGSTENSNKTESWAKSRQIRAERPASKDNSTGEPSPLGNQLTSQQQSPKKPRSSNKQGSRLLHRETALRELQGNRTIIRQCPEQGTQQVTYRLEIVKLWENNPQRASSAHNMIVTNQPACNNKQILDHGYHPWSDDCTNSAAQKRIPGHQISQDKVASEDNKLLFIPCYDSKGAFDILNRGTTLKLINAILPLAHISTTELMTVEFTPYPNNKDKEATLTSWATSAIIDHILVHQDTFSARGIVLQKLELPRYPNLLVLQQKKGGSILKRAVGVETSPSSWDHLTIVKNQSTLHPGMHQQIFIGTPSTVKQVGRQNLNGRDENPEYIHICSWNTHGLKNLVTDKAALSFLQQFEIVMLHETWYMEPIQISGYSGIDVSAKQPQRHGQPKGGLTSYCSTKINLVIKQIGLGIDWLLLIKIGTSGAIRQQENLTIGQCIHTS